MRPFETVEGRLRGEDGGGRLPPPPLSLSPLPPSSEEGGGESVLLGGQSESVQGTHSQNSTEANKTRGGFSNLSLPPSLPPPPPRPRTEERKDGGGGEGGGGVALPACWWGWRWVVGVSGADSKTDRYFGSQIRTRDAAENIRLFPRFLE